MNKKPLTQRLSLVTLRNTLEYKPEIGAFVGVKDRQRKGLSTNSHGYIVINIDGVSFQAHRLAWMYMTGKYPEQNITFKDGNPKNLRWNNLEEATQQEIAFTKPVQKNSSTGVKGLTIYKGKYKATIMVNKKTKSKTFELDQKELAVKWLEETRKELHGDFANAGNGRNVKITEKAKTGYWYDLNRSWLKHNTSDYRFSVERIPNKVVTAQVEEAAGIKALRALAEMYKDYQPQ